MKSPVAAALLSSLLAGCASDCSILSGNSSSACQAQLGTLAIVGAPVALPYALLKNASENYADIQSERDLRRGVEAGERAASERCLFVCKNAYRELKDDRWKLLRQAAEQILAAEAQAASSPRQQAVLLAAHKVLADALWREAPTQRIEHLREVVRLGQSSELWAYVRLSTDQGNDFPVNGLYFQNAAEDAMLDLLRFEHEATWQAGDRTPPDDDVCNLMPFGQLPALAGRDGSLLCRLAASDWKRRHPIANSEKN